MKNISIITGINSIEEVKRILNYSDEFYFGLNEIKNHRYFNKNYNLTLKEAIKIIFFIKKIRKKIYLAPNEVYNKDELIKIISIINHLKTIGLDGVIIRDLNLLLELKTKNNLKIIISSTACVFNSNTIKFFVKEGASRIILPQQIELDETIQIIKKFKNIEFEIFYLPDSYCANIDGICFFHTFKKQKTAFSNCKQFFYLDNKKIKMRIPCQIERTKILENLINAGIKFIKIPRDGSIQSKIKNILILKEIINGKGNNI